MSVRLTTHWPFLAVIPSEHEVKAREAVKEFEETEQRALKLQELRTEIGEITSDARAMQQSYPDV